MLSVFLVLLKSTILSIITTLFPRLIGVCFQRIPGTIEHK
jgi:hypothetical protein